MNVLIKEGLYVVQNNFDQRVLCAKCTFQMCYNGTCNPNQEQRKYNGQIQQLKYCKEAKRGIPSNQHMLNFVVFHVQLFNTYLHILLNTKQPSTGQVHVKIIVVAIVAIVTLFIHLLQSPMGSDPRQGFQVASETLHEQVL